LPHARMKAVGLVTRTFVDDDTGEQLAAVHVPTAPTRPAAISRTCRSASSRRWIGRSTRPWRSCSPGGGTAPDQIRFCRRPIEAPAGAAVMSEATHGIAPGPVEPARTAQLTTRRDGGAGSQTPCSTVS
jgi:hypothetical protein